MVHVRNQLEEATSVHWHGMHLPARMDGGPHQPVAPGETWSPTWTIDQPAATLWYHPHLHGSTAEHVYRGLAGLFLLDDERAATLGLPDRYGDDIPLIVQDKAFTGDGQLDVEADSFRHTGILGDTVLVNGTPGPHLDVTTERVRLRLLNGSNARVYDFHLDDGSPFQLIATDGGLLPAAVETDHVQLSPGERAEVVVALAPGERRVLRSEAPDLGASWWNGRLAGGDDRLDVLELRAADRLEPNGDVPAVLGGAAPDPGEPDRTRTFDLGGTSINGHKMAMDRIDEVVTAGDTEVWEVTNKSDVPHSFHVHDVQFRLLGDVSPELGG